MGVMEEILAELRKLNAKFDHIGGAVAPVEAPPAPPAPAAPKAEKAPKAPKAEKAPAQEAQKGEPSPAVGAATIDYPAVSAATKAKVTSGKRAEVVALLATYGVKHGQELKPEQYAEYMAKLAAL